MTDEAAILAASALVSSGLDYCNSLFSSLSSLNMRKLQCIQNTLPRIVTKCILKWYAAQRPLTHLLRNAGIAKTER